MTDTPGIGHNSGNAQLKSIVERVERLEDEKAALSDDVKDIYAEAKSNGYDVKTLRKLVRLRKQDASQREEEAALLDTYLHAMGMAAALA